MACLLMIFLTIGASGELAKTEGLRFFGDCLVREKTFDIYISPYSTDLNIVHNSRQYIIRMPKEQGMYELQYTLGSDTATFLPGGDVPVRIGSRGFY